MHYSVLNRLKCIFMLLLTLSFINAALAQNVPVKGKVTDSSGEPLVGVSVKVAGSSTGTQTNVDGVYSLNAPKNGTLIFTYIGFNNREVAIGGRSTINVQLTAAATSLNEVVVTGYTAQRKKDITGAVTVVNVAEMAKQPTAQVTQQLQGQASGVSVIGSGQPGESPQIRIRGINTFGNNTPLFVVDGAPTQNISDLNPNDIESLQVLKDAGSASIYGSRANNGVIIITTKKGKGNVQVSYDAYYGTQRPISNSAWNLLNPQEMAQLKFNALGNSGTPVDAAHPDPLYGGGPTPVLPDYIYPTGAHEGDPSVDPSKYYVNPEYSSSDELGGFYRINKANKAGTNWYNELFSPAPMQQHNVAVSGGGEQGNFFISGNYYNQQGTLMNTYMKRYSIRANTSFNIKKIIRIGENFGYSISDNPRVNAQDEGSPIGFSFREQPIIPVYDIMGNFAGTYGGQLGNASNPVANAFRMRNNKGLANRLFGNVFADVDILKSLTFHTSFGGENYSNRSNWFNYPQYENVENGTSNSYNEYSGFGYNYTWTNTLTFRKKFDKHNVSVLAGYEVFDSRGSEVGAATQGYFSFDPDYTTLSTGSGTQTHYNNKWTEGLESMFGRLDYTFNDKYLLAATIRRDGSSKFLNYQYGWFPAFSAGWRVSQENFLKDVNWISDLKLRATWGIMGNQLNVNPNNSFTTFNSDKNASYYDINGSNNAIVQGFRQGQIGNPDAKWEKDINSNIGFDLSLFKGRVDITADYYKKDIKDLLYQLALPATAGNATAPFVNVGGVKNTGVDLSIATHNNLTSDLKLDATLTFTSYNNTITQVTEGGSNYFWSGGYRRYGTAFIRNEVGHPINTFYGYKIDGFWNSQAEVDQANAQAQQQTSNPSASYQTDAGVGRFRYRDVNGDGLITADDRTFLGSPNPDFSAGLNLALTYKNFDFSAFFYGVSGSQLWNNVKWWTDFYPSFAGTKSTTALYNSWTPTNTNAKAPIQENSGNFSTNGTPNSYYIEDGSYLRARNIMFGYTLPKTALQKVGVNNLRIYLQASNLFTVTKYSGLDPEISNVNSGNPTLETGIDEGSYASPRQFLFGVQLKF